MGAERQSNHEQPIRALVYSYMLGLIKVSFISYISDCCWLDDSPDITPFSVVHTCLICLCFASP